jgi:hypothetical protein
MKVAGRANAEMFMSLDEAERAAEEEAGARLRLRAGAGLSSLRNKYNKERAEDEGHALDA